MPKRTQKGAGVESHQRAAELHGLAGHAHTAASAAHEKQDHLTANEVSRHALETTLDANAQTHQLNREFGHATIEAAAHSLWVERGSPQGSPDQDWFQATKQLRATALRD